MPESYAIPASALRPQAAQAAQAVFTLATVPCGTVSSPCS